MRPTATERIGKTPLGAFFAPDTLLPDQIDPGHKLSPEQKLLWALIDDAVIQLRGQPTSTQFSKIDLDTLSPKNRHDLRHAARMRLELNAWVRSDEDDYLCSFTSCCHHLNMNTDYIRRLVLRNYQPWMDRILITKPVRPQRAEAKRQHHEARVRKARTLFSQPHSVQIRPDRTSRGIIWTCLLLDKHEPPKGLVLATGETKKAARVLGVEEYKRLKIAAREPEIMPFVPESEPGNWVA